MALFQGVIFLLLAPFAGVHLTFTAVVAGLVVMVLVSFALTSVGLIIAWRMQSIQGFHAIMNLFLIPMWLLSGALFPAAGASPWVRLLMAVNPLTYGVEAVRLALYGHPGATVPAAITAAFALLMIGAGALAVQRTGKG